MINKVVKWRIRRSLSKNYTTIWTLFFCSYSKGPFIVRQVTEDSFLLTTHRWRRNRTKMLCPVSKEVSLWSNDFNNSLQLKGNEFLLLDSPIMRNIFSLSIGKAHLEFTQCIKEIFLSMEILTFERSSFHTFSFPCNSLVFSYSCIVWEPLLLVIVLELWSKTWL